MKKDNTEVLVPAVQSVEVKEVAEAVDTAPVEPVEERLSLEDALMLERADVKRQLAQKDVQAANLALAVTESDYKNVVMKLFMKNNLTASDVIEQSGRIIRNHKFEG